METMKNTWASQSLDQDFNFIPSQACSKTANHWIKRHFVRYDVKAYVTCEISGLVLKTMGLKELYICECVCVCPSLFFVNRHIQNAYLSNKVFPRNDDYDNICRSGSLCLKILSRCCVLYAATCILVIRRSLGFDFEY